MHKNTRRLLLLFLCSISSTVSILAVDDTKPMAVNPSDITRQYTEEHPLIYEDAWDLWPYVFLNENGEAVGYNIDVLKLIFRELNISCVIKLKPTDKVLNDLKAGHAHLTLGMDAFFHNDYGQYGKSVIHIFTHSIVHRKDEPVEVRSVDDLAHHKVIVHRGSFSHHLMEQRGWGQQADPYNDMQEAIQLVHNEPGHQIIWNTLSLKWLLRKFHYDDLELTPVNVQHGEYKFMSNDTHLLHQLDSVYAKLNAEGRFQPIQNKWFYPERKDSGIPSWIWVVISILLLFTLVSIIFYFIYRNREKKMTKSLRKSNRRLSLILKTSNVRVWVYNIATKTIMAFDDNAQQEGEKLSLNNFFFSILEEDFHRIEQALSDISLGKVEKCTLDVQSKDDSLERFRHISINLCIFRHDKNNKPTDIIGTSSDITEEQLRQQKVKDNVLRYQSVFNSAMADIVAYDEHGIIIDMNDKVRSSLPDEIDSILNAKISVRDVLGSEFKDLKHLEYTYVTQLLHWPNDNRALSRLLKRPEMFYELQMLPLRDANGRLLAVYGTGRNVTDIVRLYKTHQANIQQLQQANHSLDRYIRNIDFVLKYGGVRIVSYSIDTHTLVIYSEVGTKELVLTQTRALTLTGDKSKRLALKAFISMDNRTHSPVEVTVVTLLHHRGGMDNSSCPLYLHLKLIPTLDNEGQVTGYFGMCRDISEIKATEEKLAGEVIKAQDVESIKNAFLRNMSYQIRTPLNSVVGFSELLEMDHDPEDEPLFIQEISDNASQLLELINDILFLSRLDAHMIEIKPVPVNFAAFFESRCQTAWTNYQPSGVSYVVDSEYKSLVLDIDAQNIGIIIDQIVANSAQHTTSGEVRVSYNYNGEELMMTFQDTGCGIPASQLGMIFDRFATTGSRGTGLGLCICKELAQQMNGKIRVQSQTSKGTIVWVSIPCHCSELVRKKKGESE